jgi:hypothetical protein
MPDLLERAGFRLRGRSRADCAHCTGHAIATVGFTDEKAHCFRCQWKANATTLAKELGLLQTDPESKRRWRKEVRELAEYRRTIERFEAWRDALIRKYSARLRQLGRSAAIATSVLERYPDCEPAWDAFARYCHEEAELSQMLDFLCCAKASPWLSEDATVLDVFETWRQVHAE